MTPEEKKTELEVLRKLKENSSWLVLCHELPDGDTLGCAYALYSLGKRTGRRVKLASKNKIPQTFDFFPHFDEATVAEELPPDEVKDALIVAVDISTERRTLSNVKELIKAARDSVSVDHHGDNTLFAATNLVIPTASATAEIVTEIFRDFGEGITKGEAAALYTALATDNGNFRFPMTSPESHKCAEILLKAGALPHAIDDRINENMTKDILRLWGAAMERAEIFADGVCALFWLRRKETEAAKADSSALDGLVNMLMRIKGVKIGIFISEREDGVKLSVRSRAPYGARELAAKFGGGGHESAAGAKIDMGFDEALGAIREEAQKYARSRNIADK